MLYRTLTLLLKSPPLPDRTMAYLLPVDTWQPVAKVYVYHVAVVVKDEAANEVLHRGVPVGLLLASTL